MVKKMKKGLMLTLAMVMAISGFGFMGAATTVKALDETTSSYSDVDSLGRYEDETVSIYSENGVVNIDYKDGRASIACGKDFAKVSAKDKGDVCFKYEESPLRVTLIDGKLSITDKNGFERVNYENGVTNVKSPGGGQIFIR